MLADLTPLESVRMTGARSENLFSYGTLRQARVQVATFGRLLKGREDALPGYRLGRLAITDPDVLSKSEAPYHPIAERSPDLDDEVAGTVFEITAAELANADDYEVSDYVRVSVCLKSGLQAWVYVRVE